MAYARIVPIGPFVDLMVMERFSMHTDKRARWTTSVFFVLLAAGLALVFYTSGGSYLPAWVSTLVASIALLGVLSIPRHALVTPFSVEVHCLVEVTRVAFSDIERVKLLENREMRWTVPFFGVYGLFGYYGYFLDLRKMRTVRVYGRRWSNFVLVEDRFARRLVVSVDDPQALVRTIEPHLIATNR